jgi:hypothetical protein
MIKNPHLTPAEADACKAIKARDRDVRAFLSWNLNNDVGIVATLIVKTHLEGRFGITDFDAGGKAGRARN